MDISVKSRARIKMIILFGTSHIFLDITKESFGCDQVCTTKIIVFKLCWMSCILKEKIYKQIEHNLFLVYFMTYISAISLLNIIFSYSF